MTTTTTTEINVDNAATKEDSMTEIDSTPNADMKSVLERGLLLERIGKFKDACSLYLSNSLYEKHPKCQVNLGRCLCKMGRFEEAIKVVNKVLSNDDEDVIILLAAYNVVADCMNKLGRVEESLSWFRKTLDASKRILGEDDVNTLRAESSLASCLFDSQEEEEDSKKEALSMMKHVAESSTKILGIDNPETIEANAYFGRCLSKMKNIESYKQDALQRISLGIEGFEKTSHKDHPNTLLAVHFMASAYMNLEKYDKALRLAKHLADVYIRNLGLKHRSTIEAMNAVSKCNKMIKQLFVGSKEWVDEWSTNNTTCTNNKTKATNLPSLREKRSNKTRRPRA